MNLHFCCDMDGWVLERIARLLMPHIPGSTIGEHVSQDADANVYFPYYRLREKGPSVDVALFTHYEKDDSESSEGKRRAFRQAEELADVRIAMSKSTQRAMIHDSVVVELPASPEFILKRPIRFGICGRQYASGRKRLDWLPTGMPGTEWIWANGTAPQSEMPRFFADIDYLIIASENEGGPIPLKEALACGKPVIAPNVGWAWEYPVIRYEGEQGLYDVIRALVPKDETFAAARALVSAIWPEVHKEAA